MMTNCCGMRLRTAGIVLGWLGIVGSVFGILLFGVLLVQRETLVNVILDGTMSHEIDSDSDDFVAKKEQLRPQIELFLSVGLSIELGASLIHTIASSLLLAGSMLERHLMVLPWLVNYGFWLAIALLYNLIYILMWPSALLVIWCTMANVISCWIFHAMHTLYKELKIKAEAKVTDRYVKFGKDEREAPPQYA